MVCLDARWFCLDARRLALMIAVDTSALMAIALGENEAERRGPAGHIAADTALTSRTCLPPGSVEGRSARPPRWMALLQDIVGEPMRASRHCGRAHARLASTGHRSSIRPRS